jgi:hypothetical protein
VFLFNQYHWTIGESTEEIVESALKLKVKMRLHVTDLADLTDELVNSLPKEF